MALVTVCIPAYKSERWLASALESVRRQTVQDVEVLIGIEPVDPEPTIRICEEYARDPRFRFQVNPKRLGWGANVGGLLARVESPYFLILFHDDWLHSRYLETLLPPLLERPELSVCYGDIKRIGGSGGRKSLALRDAGLAEQLLDFFLGRAYAVPVRGIARSSTLEGVRFPTNKFGDFAVECEWTVHLLERGRALHVARPLYLKRVFPEEAVSVSGGWLFTMPLDELRAALENHRRRLLDRVHRAPLDDEERRPILMAAEVAVLHHYVQLARGRFHLDDQQRELLHRIRREAGDILEPSLAARLRWMVDWAEQTDAEREIAKPRPPRKRRVAVIGAGIQGVCSALELAHRGYPVTLVERTRKPMEAASRWNEGKVHLGYLWARDRSLRTARQVLLGSLSFARGIEQLTGSPIPEYWLSEPFLYGVPASSLLGADELAVHFRAVDRLFAEELARNGCDYFGRRKLRPSTAVEVDGHFDAMRVTHAFATEERSVDPHRVADALSDAMRAHSGISFTKSHAVTRLTRRGDGRFEVWSGEQGQLGRFDAVVNAAGGSRLALDRSAGIDPPRKWLHRYKLAAYIPAPGVEAPSTTLVHGPFGDVVRFEGGLLYLSWYPVCRIAMSGELELPDPGVHLTRGDRIEIARASWNELASFLPALRDRQPDWKRAGVGGGHIPAWGSTDVDDPESGLHARFEIGVFSKDGYHSVDPGKYGMAPMYARVVADRIDAGAWP